MKKITVMMALVCSFAAVNSFAADKDKGMKGMKCSSGKECCKKMSKMSAMDKAKCKKMCDEAAAKKAK